LTRKRKRLIAVAATALLLALTILGTLLFRERVQRRRVFRPEDAKMEKLRGIPPVEQWSVTFRRAPAKELDALLDAIEQQHSDLYGKWSLSYLHARALVDLEEESEAAKKLAPYLVKGHPFRDRALYHRASIADEDEASRFRTMLIVEHSQSIYRDEAIDEELEHLAEQEDPKALIDFAAKVTPAASTERRREMSARVVEALVERGQLEEAFTRGFALLRGGTGDDASDRVARALDRPEILRRLNVEQLAMFGETLQKHRHYERAATVLRNAVRQRYSDDLQFALGRSYFGAEKYEEARVAYLRGVNATKNANRKTTFFWHAARAAQLGGEDAVAEKLMTAAIAVKGKFPSTTPALTQRLRTRLKQGRLAEAASDLALLRKIAGNERAILEGSLAYAVGMIARDRNTAAISALNSVPPKLLNAHDRAEFAYWRGRALEGRDRAAAKRAYEEVIESTAPTHFRHFAMARLSEPPPRREKLDLQPLELPRFPTVDAKDPDALLMAMGLFDEAVPAIEKRWGLRDSREALTRAYALNLAGAARESIYAAEVLVDRLPGDVTPDRLPPLVHDLLYPRYFYGYIAEDAKNYDVDPALVLAIMREESRFNPRAKSQAAARGLLQFIITTARDIGRDIGLVDVDPEDLYDPRVIIRLGAKYMSELGEKFDGNHYRVTAAYNAGPKQVALWSRLQPAAGDDYFLTAVSFDETKHYVRKVMNSYAEYRRDEGKRE
jgi:soluble lytic murein transglycosylase-like protein